MLFYSCKVFYLVILLIRKLTKFCSYRQPDMILDLYVNCTWWKAPFGITDRPDGPTKKKEKDYTHVSQSIIAIFIAFIASFAYLILHTG